MNRNIEIKARLRSLAPVMELARQVSDCAPRVLQQEDTFFRVPRGRLKLRKLSPGLGELIYYEREDRAGPTLSRYAVAPVSDPDALRSVLADALGVRGTVSKQRTLLLCGRTRIHLDEVEGLGAYLELEVVMAPEENEEKGRRAAEELMAKLGIRPELLEDRAYIDILESRNAREPASLGRT